MIAARFLYRYDLVLHGAGHFTGPQAASARIDVTGLTVDDRLDALDIGLPHPIGSTVGVGDLDPERHALAAKITLGHCSNLLAVQNLPL